MVTKQVAAGKTATQQDAAVLVKHAMRADCEILLRSGTMTVNAKSLMGVLSLAVREGAILTIQVKGAGEEAALEKIADLIENGFKD